MNNLHFFQVRRQEDHLGQGLGLMSLYPAQTEIEIVERRLKAVEPQEHKGYRILVQCIKLELSLQVRRMHFVIIFI